MSNKRNKNNIISLCILILIITIFTGCSKEKKNNMIISIADVGSDANSFCINTSKYIIEKGYGYDVELSSGTVLMLWEALTNGKVDVHMSVAEKGFSPYKKALEDGIVSQIGTAYDGVKMGYYVPAYVIEGDLENGIEAMAPNLKHLKDLPQYWEVFKDPEDDEKGRLYSGPAGWLSDEVTHIKLKTYGLEHTYNLFTPGDNPALETELITAIEKKKPYVGFYMRPSWIAAKHELILLEDEPYTDEAYSKEGNYSCEYPDDTMRIVFRKGFDKECPLQVQEFFQNYGIPVDYIGEVLLDIEENKVEMDDIINKFFKEREDIWTRWVPEDVVKNIKATLN